MVLLSGGIPMRTKAIFLPLIFLSMALCGCASEPERGGPSSSGEPASFSDETPSSSAEPSSSDFGSSSLSKYLDPAEDIAARLVALGGSYASGNAIFTYGGGSSFSIGAYMRDDFNDETYRTSASFTWGSLKGVAIDGSATIGEGIFRVTLRCDYGSGGSLTLTSYDVSESTIASEQQGFYASLLVSIQESAFDAIQSFVSPYSLW